MGIVLRTPRRAHRVRPRRRRVARRRVAAVRPPPPPHPVPLARRPGGQRCRRGPVPGSLGGPHLHRLPSASRWTPWRLAFALAADAVPFSVRHKEGETRADGPLGAERYAGVRLRLVECPRTGVARFEGVRLEVSDLQGFFAHITRSSAPPSGLHILPAPYRRPRRPADVQAGQRPAAPWGPPASRRPAPAPNCWETARLPARRPAPDHRLESVGASAARLMTRTDFESAGAGPRHPLRRHRRRHPRPLPRRRPAHRPDVGVPPLDRLLEIAAAVVRSAASIRDLTGLVLFDEPRHQEIRPARGGAHVGKLMAMLW